MKPAMFWLFLSIVCLCGSLAFAYRAGRSMGRNEQFQLVVTNRELMQMRKALQAQLESVRDAVSRLHVDPRTHAHTRLELESLLDRLRIRGS